MRVPQVFGIIPSWQAENQHRLSQEEKITVLNHDAVWGREVFCRRRPPLDEFVFAYSTDSRGRIVRCWKSRPHDTDCFEERGSLVPAEAVILEFVRPGVPGLSAHLLLRPEYPVLREQLKKMWERHSSARV